MKKRVILFLISMLMLSFVGCSQDVAKTENLVGEKINNQYLYYSITDDRWDNKEYAYGVQKTFIVALNDEKTTLYSIREDKEECLELADTKLIEDGYGIEYTFKSGSEDEYKLNVLLNKDNEDDIKFTLDESDGKSYSIEDNMLSKEECEDKIKSSINEVELENMIATSFNEVSNLDLDKIKSDIDNAREKIFEQTKESKDEVYYVYSPSGSYCDEDDDFKLQNYVFVGVYLDENGEIITINDFAYLVDANDFTLYEYSPNGANKNEKKKKYKEKIEESLENNNEASNEITSNDLDKKGKYSVDQINEKLEKDGYEQGCVIDGPIYYNNEWCYLVSYMSNPETYRMSEFYIGSDTLQIYSYDEVN